MSTIKFKTLINIIQLNYQRKTGVLKHRSLSLPFQQPHLKISMNEFKVKIIRLNYQRKTRV